MTKTKRIIKERNLKFIELWDKPSKKGYPTKESVLITIAIDDIKNENDINTGGFTIKVPGDNPIPKIGRAIAVRNMYAGIFDIDEICPEKHILNFFECRPYLQKFSNDIKNRIKIICGLTEGIVNRKEY